MPTVVAIAVHRAPQIPAHMPRDKGAALLLCVQGEEPLTGSMLSTVLAMPVAFTKYLIKAAHPSDSSNPTIRASPVHTAVNGMGRG